MFTDELPDDEAFRLQKAYAPLRSFDERMTRPGFRRMLEERDDALAKLLAHRLEKPLSDCRILDFGCGSGRIMDWLGRHGASPEKMTGIELQPDRVAMARQTYPDLTFIEGSGEHLPFIGRQFDIVLAFTVFSSILDHSIATRIASELTRVLSPGGAIIWYDMRYPNPFNSHLRAMPMSRIRRLFPTLTPELKTMTLLPPVAERLGPLTDALYPPLAAIPAFRSHYFGLLRSKP